MTETAKKVITEAPKKTSKKPTAAPAAVPKVVVTEAVRVSLTAGEDIEKNKIWAVVSYLGIIGILIVALTDAKDSPFAKFHLNQALLLMIGTTVGICVSILIPIVGWFILLPVVQTAATVFWILGVVYSAQGQTKRLPLIGNYDLLK